MNKIHVLCNIWIELHIFEKITSIIIVPFKCMSCDSSRYSNWLQAGQLDDQGLGIFLFDTMSRQALGPAQPPIKWVPGALSLGVKWLRREADHSPPSSAEVKECVELYLHTPNTSLWHGA
jgi:hypothetical protein